MQAKVTESKQYVSMNEGATALAPADERLRYWEDYTASELVGIRCTSYAESGLDARQRNFDLGAFRIADIVGNEHVVERSMPQVRRHPKHSLLACLLMEGEAFFFQSGRCTMVHSGDLIVYNSVKPYLFGFTRPMRLLMVDISPSDLFESAGAPVNESMIKVDGHLRAGKMLTQHTGPPPRASDGSKPWDKREQAKAAAFARKQAENQAAAGKGGGKKKPAKRPVAPR